MYLGILPLYKLLMQDETHARAFDASILSRRPSELSSTENVKVEMIHRLAPLLSVVDDNPEAVGQVLLFSYFSSH